MKASEFTMATTTLCYDPLGKDRAWEIIEEMGIHSHIFEKIVAPGTILGNLEHKIAEKSNSGEVKGISVASHDTQSAIFAVPT